jgi:hypothetical protein
LTALEGTRSGNLLRAELVHFSQTTLMAVGEWLFVISSIRHSPIASRLRLMADG